MISLSRGLAHCEHSLNNVIVINRKENFFNWQGFGVLFRGSGGKEALMPST